MKYSFFIYTFLFVLLFFSCKEKQKADIVITNIDSTIKPIKLSLSDLKQTFKQLHGKWIETEGKFHNNFEDVSICPEIILNDEPDCFWLDFNQQLLVNDSLINEANRKRVIIRGKIDTTRKGHMSSYLATIREIYFFKEAY